MAVKYIADLGPDGWITDGRTMLDKVTSWLYASDFSQSYFFAEEISSIAMTIQRNAGNLEKARSQLQELLTNYYFNFFDEVSVEITIVDYQFPESHLRGELMIRASMVDHTGTSIDLNEIMTKKGSMSRTVLDYPLL